MRDRERGPGASRGMPVAAAAGVMMAVVLGGCGQSGPLYLPERSSATVSPSASAAAPMPMAEAAGRTGQVDRTEDGLARS